MRTRFRAKTPGRKVASDAILLGLFASRRLCARMVFGSRGADGTTQADITATPLRGAPARHVAPGPVRHRRPRSTGPCVDRDVGRRKAVVVAGPATGADRLRRFALPVLLRLRWKSEPDQPGTARR